MKVEYLNVEKVAQLRKQRGIQIRWLIDYVGLKYTSGHQMFRNGVLPRDPAVNERVLEKLSSFFGVEVTQLLLRPQQAKTA